MNTTYASIGARKKVTTNHLWQYDYGQRLIITGVTLPATYEVLFGIGGELTEMIGDESGVDIPDALLQTGNDISAYVFLHTGSDDGETVYEITIPVKARPNTSEEPLEPTEQSIITQAIAVLNNAVETTTEYMQTTKGYMDDAETYAERAEQAANTAGYMEFEIIDGGLYYTRTDAVDVDFVLDDGYLYMEVSD